MSKRSERLIRLLKYYIGDVFTEVEPVGNLWKPKKNTVFIRPKRDRTGFISWLQEMNFIETVDEAGNGIYRVKIKKGCKIL